MMIAGSLGLCLLLINGNLPSREAGGKEEEGADWNRCIPLKWARVGWNKRD